MRWVRSGPRLQCSAAALRFAQGAVQRCAAGHEVRLCAFQLRHLLRQRRLCCRSACTKAPQLARVQLGQRLPQLRLSLR